VQDRADRRKVAEVAVLQKIKSGELRAIDTDWSWRFADGDLKYFLKARAASPP
jgi:hypothetical protein